MSLLDVYIASNDAEFQGRCWAAATITAQHVIVEDEGYDVSLASKNYALKLLRDESSVTERQIAMQVLRNATIASSPSTASDSDIDWQIKQIWPELVNIG